MAVIAHIEDCDTDHMLLREALEEAHHDVVHFQDVESFMASDRSFDLVVADLQLPRSYGFETLNAVRVTLPTTPVIVMSGLGAQFITRDVSRAMVENGASHVFSKDLLMDGRLADIVDGVLVQKPVAQDVWVAAF